MNKIFFLIFILGISSCERNSEDHLPSEIQKIEAFLDESFSNCPTGGVVLVAINGETVFIKAYGMADLELNVPMQTDHVLATGSITKQFTAAAILQLVQQGRISLQDDVRKFIPDFQTHNRTITIEQLLNHTSGLPNFVDLDSFDSIYRKDLSPSEILELTKNEPLHFEPGTYFYYTDTGYILLGLIIEKVTGLSYSNYIEEKLFRPAGMNSTWYADNTRIIPNRVKGYSMINNKISHTEFISMTIPYSAGAVFSTVGDLLLWSNALNAEAVISDTLLKLARSPVVLSDGTINGYGFGWKICNLEGHRTFEHGGFVNGFFARLLELPDDGIIISVMVNNDADIPDPSIVTRKIGRYLLTGSFIPHKVQLIEEEKNLLLGEYFISQNDKLSFFERNDSLFVSRNGRRDIPLYAISPTELGWLENDGAIVYSFKTGNDQHQSKVTFFSGCEFRYSAYKK